MTASEMGAEATHRQDLPQAGHYARLTRVLAAAALAGAVAGCSSLPGFRHRLEGGQIAKPLQPPPGLNKPYPNLASVPARPAPPNQAELQRLSQSLIADREHAEHLTVPAGPDPSLPATSPGLFGVGSLAPPAPQPAGSGATATLAAVQGPKPGVATPAAAPSAPSPPARVAQNAVVQPVPPSPALPAGPPAPPQIAPLGPPAGPGGTPLPGSSYGGNPPGAATAAHSPAQPPSGAVAANAVPTGPAAVPPTSIPGRVRPTTSPALPANPADTVDVSFPPASAVLPAEAADALHALGRRRGARAIEVTGRGEASSSAAEAQSEGLSLGLKRAQAMAQALAAVGVPNAAIRLHAQASGRGGTARILQ